SGDFGDRAVGQVQSVDLTAVAEGEHVRQAVHGDPGDGHVRWQLVEPVDWFDLAPQADPVNAGTSIVVLRRQDVNDATPVHANAAKAFDRLGKVGPADEPFGLAATVNAPDAVPVG